MRFIGLTGSFGSGKSLVTDFLVDEGATLIDADLLARDVVASGEIAYHKIVEVFGIDILSGNNEINREKLAQIVFADSAKLAQLNKIVHREIEKKRLYLVDQYMNIPHIDIVIYSAPLLFETRMESLFQQVILVTVSEETRMERLIKYRKFTEKEVVARLQYQFSQDRKIKKSNYFINNDGTVENTKKETKNIYKRLQQLPLYSPGISYN